MLKTYRIIPSTFILFLFGLTLITVAPVKAQTQIEKLIERIEKLEAFHSDVGSESKSDSGNIEAPPAGPWDPSMGMRHPARPCMKTNSCGTDLRSPEQIASDPYDKNNPRSLAGTADHKEMRSPHLREIDATPQGRGRYCYKERNFIRECTYRGGKYIPSGLSGGMGRCVASMAVRRPVTTACQDARGMLKNIYK